MGGREGSASGGETGSQSRDNEPISDFAEAWWWRRVMSTVRPRQRLPPQTQSSSWAVAGAFLVSFAKNLQQVASGGLHLSRICRLRY